MGKGGYNGGSTVIHAGSGWFGGGSVTSRPADKKKASPHSLKPKRKKSAKVKNAVASKKGNGLTIAEKIRKADQKVLSLESEIGKTRRHLAALERDLTRAKSEAEAARNLPRKTALGAALHEAGKLKTATPATSGVDAGADKPVKKPKRKAGKKHPSGLRNVIVENRAAGKLISERIVKAK
ncbi:hypothetical protein [Sphingorhabdus contaminans]|uniref:hypothetical protein n=1 Tax=Sphingorhabdus contaminans TaxID=1343899 RepID=UPI003D27CAAD